MIVVIFATRQNWLIVSQMVNNIFLFASIFIFHLSPTRHLQDFPIGNMPSGVLQGTETAYPRQALCVVCFFIPSSPMSNSVRAMDCSFLTTHSVLPFQVDIKT